MNKRVIVFTASFPFGVKENFLETEIPFLSHRFDEVRLLPFGGLNDRSRPVPANCIVDSRLQCTRRQRILRGLFGSWRVFPLYLKDLLNEKPYRSIKSFRLWMTSLLCSSFYLSSRPIKELLNEDLSSTVFYFYWGVIYNSLAYFIRDKVKMVSRFHGDWDLWKSSTEEGYKPIRKPTIDAITSAALISNKGLDFFKSRYPDCKTIVSHLGSLDHGVANKSHDGVLRVISCSTVYPLKRVQLIFDSLLYLSKKRIVDWTHLGGGPDFESLKSHVDVFRSPSFSVHLIGEIPLDSVISYYREHSVDVFVNLSTNEGVPVSIMEAISFNIPIVATDVGGTSEIVNNETGLLVTPNPSCEEVASAIEFVITKGLTPRSFWRKEFNAVDNYTSFAEYLYNL